MSPPGSGLLLSSESINWEQRMVSVAVLVMVEAEGRGVMCVNILPLANTSGFTKVTALETDTEIKGRDREGGVDWDTDISPDCATW